MNILTTNKPLVKASVEKLMRYQTIAYYAISGINEELKTATDEESLDLWIARNKWKMIYEHIKNLLENK